MGPFNPYRWFATLAVIALIIGTEGSIIVLFPAIAVLLRDTWIAWNIFSFLFCEAVRRFFIGPCHDDTEKTKAFIRNLRKAHIVAVPDYVERACFAFDEFENDRAVRAYTMIGEKDFRFDLSRMVFEGPPSFQSNVVTYVRFRVEKK